VPKRRKSRLGLQPQFSEGGSDAALKVLARISFEVLIRWPYVAGVTRFNQKQQGRDTKVTRTGLAVFRWIWTACIVFATSVPYLLNFFSTPAHHHYTWIMPPYPEDSLAYMAWSQQAAHGSLLFQVKYTALPQSPFLFHPFFLICGWLSWLLGCDIGIVHWVLKAVGTALFLITFFKYTDYLRLSGFQSIAASILVGISSGLGSLSVFSGFANWSRILPADLLVPEVSTYWSLLWNPLFPYSLTLMLLTIYWLDRGTREGRKSDLWFGGLATGILALIHPYSLPLLFILALLITLVRRGAEGLGYLCRYFSVSFPSVLYLVLVTRFQSVISRHSSLGEMTSPSLPAYLLGFGIPLLIFAGGVVVGRGQWVKQYWQLVLWFLVSVALSYFPFWFQRKLIFGAHIPLCILAGISFDLLLTRCFGPRARRWALAVAAVVLVPLLVSTPIALLASESRVVRANADGAYYISDDMMNGLKFLKGRSKPNQVVFATPTTSRLTPAFSGNTVVWGHWAMSVDREERQKWITDLFNQNSDWADDKRSSEFWGTDIQYIFADGQLKQSIEQNPWRWQTILRDADKVFSNGSVAIYQHHQR